MDTLKFINYQNKTQIYNDNLTYLKDLNKSIEKIIELLKKIKLKSITLNKTISYLNLSNNTELNFIGIKNEIYIELLNFLEKTIHDIQILQFNIPDYNNLPKQNFKKICNEYFVFHNNIIEKIKKFINYYTEYISKLYKLYELIKKSFEPITAEYNCLIYNYNNNSVCRNDPNFSLNKNALDNKINEITEYNNYIVNEINYFDEIKTNAKNINKIFLNNIKKISY